MEHDDIAKGFVHWWFKSIRSTDMGDNWILSLNNLKKLYRLVTQYYEEVLGYPATRLDEPDLSTIAKHDNSEELLKLWEASTTNPDSDNHDMEIFDAQHHDEGIDPDELEKSARELSTEHKHVQSKYEELLVLNEELKMRMEDLEQSMARADKSGRADFLLRAEIDNLKHELEKADTRAQETERIMAEQQSALADMTRKLADRDATADEAVRLRDQLQEYKHAAERLAKSEHVIEKYKKKLEESEQLASAQDRTRQIEDEFHKMSSRRPAMDDVRDGFQQLESRHNMTVLELSQAMERLRKTEDERDRLAADRQHGQEQIQALEEQLRELELTLDKGLAMDLDDDRTELLTKIARLERELKAARNAQPQTDATEFLEEVADAATREKDTALEQLEKERAARAQLEHQLAEHAESVPRLKSDLDAVTTQLVSATSDAGAARNDLAAVKEELERSRAALLAVEQQHKAVVEAASLRDENKSLEDWLAETHQESQQFEQEIARLSAANRELTGKLGKSTEEQTRLEIALRGQGDIERLQRELVKAREEVHVLQVSLKRTKDHCVTLDQKLQQQQAWQCPAREEQLESVRTMLREQNNTHLLESRTMASAWFNLQRQLERQSGFGHSSGMGSLPSARQAGTPASWLGQQRVTLDMQLTGA
ncbi:hypothetical protein DL89DRAFT_321112 [Linderina pennispora]|uniref:HOOK N-terminal domain-containing protein n=1 Tax=Linderina pennispora TaxID=61395 RepID=A0A1Y1WF03_9FUNG|nr:uncharacterized protein DL89DRAFT_321112 [Linderina pennispora]ORX71965.1 hypothetical protein DL89DRAFT_321112 [Linderina pennispora]